MQVYKSSLRQAMVFLLAVLVAASTARAALAGGPSARELIPTMVKRFATVTDYTCRLDKRVRKEDAFYEDPGIAVKYRKPRHYYFRWEQGPARGREVIYVHGQNHDRLVAHPGGGLRFLTLHLDPAGRLAMKANRHSLQHSGLEKIVELVASNYDLSLKKGIHAIHCAGQGCFDSKAVWIVEGVFPPDQGFYARKVILLLDTLTGLPVKISIFDGSDRLVEEYAFRNLQINVGLTEADFDPANPEYHYFTGLKP
jgi:outer membrane lipoprotein-sorting protein